MKPRAEPPLFKVEFVESIAAYEPAPVHLELVYKRGAPPTGRPLTMDEYRSLGAGPKIDTSVPFQFSVASKAMPGELRDYLRFSEPKSAGLAVEFWVEPSETLINLDAKHFDRIVREEFIVTIKVKLTPTFGTVSGKFRVKVESAVKIHWKWTGHPLGFPDMSGGDRPIVLQPDGFSWFKLKVWAVKWNVRDGQMERTDPEAYEFTHWIGPGNRDINFGVFRPEPVPPWHPTISKTKQDENDWYSKADLPDLARFPALNHLPVHAEMRVRAWNRGSIVKRTENDVDANEAEVGEVVIPIVLVKWYILTISVFLVGDPTPLRTYRQIVNGERVTVFCPNLPHGVDATIRWKLSGPAQYIVPPGSGLGVPQPLPFFGLASKRRYQTEDRDAPLVPVIAPSGKACLGTESPLEIVDDPASEAKPPVYLDVEAKLRVDLVASSTGQVMRIEPGQSVGVTFGVTYGGRVPARNVPLTWKLIPNPGTTHGTLRPTAGTTDGRGDLRAAYDHDVTPIIRRRTEIRQKIIELERYVRDRQAELQATRENLQKAQELKRLLIPPVNWQVVEHLYREMFGTAPRSNPVPGSGPRGDSRYWLNLTPDDSPMHGYVVGLAEEARAAATRYDADIQTRIPDLINKAKNEIQGLQRLIEEETRRMTPTSERVDFFHNGQPVNPVMLPLDIRVAEGGSAARSRTRGLATSPLAD